MWHAQADAGLSAVQPGPRAAHSVCQGQPLIAQDRRPHFSWASSRCDSDSTDLQLPGLVQGHVHHEPPGQRRARSVRRLLLVLLLHHRRVPHQRCVALRVACLRSVNRLWCGLHRSIRVLPRRMARPHALTMAHVFLTDCARLLHRTPPLHHHLFPAVSRSRRFQGVPRGDFERQVGPVPAAAALAPAAMPAAVRRALPASLPPAELVAAAERCS